MTKVRWSRRAIGDAIEARTWYLEQEARVVPAFLAELDDAVARIERSPLAFPLYLENTRRFLLKKFPYFVVYRASQDGAVLIVAVAHTSRRPGYWLT
jgi:plasmid stabilization system protein ParE